MVLVTGGTGYIGSHTVCELVRNNYEVLIIDNLSNSEKSVLERVTKIVGKEVKFVELDMTNLQDLNKVFKENKIESVIHFAGYKAVGESVAEPLKYYDNNLVSTINLLKCMEQNGVKNLVFSSSATVYGDINVAPFNEEMPTSATNPYGETKRMIEIIIKDYCSANPDFNATLLRYFNPVGADKTGFIGEKPVGIPNNLTPYITQVAVGIREKLSVYGNDYDTKDGTAERDYIHILDLSIGHVKALRNIKGFNVYNLGTGTPISVLEVVSSFEKATGIKIPYEIVARRAGDIATSYADSSKAKKELGFTAELGIIEMLEDAYRWQEFAKTLDA